MVFARIINCQKHTSPELVAALLIKQDWTTVNGSMCGNYERESFGRNSEISDNKFYSINLPAC